MEEGEDTMSDEEGDGVEGEGDMVPLDWRVRGGPRHKPTQKEREEPEATHVPCRDWWTRCRMDRGCTHHNVTNPKVRIHREDPHSRWTIT